MAEAAASELTVGVIGLGFMGTTHLQRWHGIPGVRIAGLSSPSGKGLDGNFNVEGNIGDGQFVLDTSQMVRTRDWAELVFHPDIQIIDICAPTEFHLDYAVAALCAGKHVICEKPLGLKWSLLQALNDVLRHAKGSFMPAMCMRFWKNFAELKAIVEEKTFEDLVSVRLQRICPHPKWSKGFVVGRNTGGALYDLGIHDIDFAFWLFGMPFSVYATGRSVVSSDDAIDDAGITLDYGTFSVHIDVSWAHEPKFQSSAELRYPGKTVFATFDSLTVNGGDPPAIKEAPMGLCGLEDGWGNQLAYFAKCVRNGVKPSVASLDDAASAVRLANAAEQSIREHRPIQILERD